MTLTVLTDNEVKKLLLALTKEEGYRFLTSLAKALNSYSSGDPAFQQQPLRTSIKKGDVSTYFMPSSTGDAVSMKIVTLVTPSAAGQAGQASQAVEAAAKNPSVSSASLSQGSVPGASAAAPASTASPSTTTTTKASTAPKGIVTLLDSTGSPVGIINAQELTAFRTALASTILLVKRQTVNTITVFGAGRQAYWHIRLALLFRGDEIRHVNIINRSIDRSLALMKAFTVGDEDEDKEGVPPPPWRKNLKDIKFSALSPDFGEYARLLEHEVGKADVIFCCTASAEPLFPPELLTSREGHKKGRYISAIGSYAPHMTELHPDIFKEAVSGGHYHRRHHPEKEQGVGSSGVVIVDTIEGCLHEAGEIIQAHLKPENLVEVGELLMIKDSVRHEIELGGKGEEGLLDWLVRGNVLYKSVGMGLMDLALGGELVRFAREKNVGTTVEGF